MIKSFLFTIFLLLQINAFADKPKLNPLASYDNEYISTHFGVAAVLDYTNFNQDDKSLEQVPRQDNQLDLRVLRTAAYGQLKFLGNWTYIVALGHADYIEDDSDTFVKIYNLEVTYHFTGSDGRLTIGKQKEPFVYQQVGYSLGLPHYERFMTSMFSTRNIGVRYINTYAQKTGTYAFGIFNDYIEEGNSISDNGTDVSGRVTKILWSQNDMKSYLHVGASARYSEANDGFIQYTAKPESDVADIYLDTGNIHANHAYTGAVETLISYKNYSFLGEYAQNKVDRINTSNVSFNGYYALVSWIVTGESRPYDERNGYALGVSPTSKYGAIELIAKYGELDMNDKDINGGHLSKWLAGVNWWLSDEYRLSVSYGTADLDRFGKNGKTDILLFRLQWSQF